MSTLESRPGYHHPDLRSALVKAGREILEEGGHAALSLRAVARRAGVSAMAPYRHFPDRAGLLAAIAADGVRMLTARLRDADGGAAGADALIAQGVGYVRFAIEYPALFRLMFGPEQPCDYPELASALADCLGVLAGRVAKTVAEPLTADMTLACWSLVHGLASLAVDGRLPPGGDAPAALAARLGRLLVAGREA